MPFPKAIPTLNDFLTEFTPPAKYNTSPLADKHTTHAVLAEKLGIGTDQVTLWRRRNAKNIPLQGVGQLNILQLARHLGLPASCIESCIREDRDLDVSEKMVAFGAIESQFEIGRHFMVFKDGAKFKFPELRTQTVDGHLAIAISDWMSFRGRINVRPGTTLERTDVEVDIEDMRERIKNAGVRNAMKNFESRIYVDLDLVRRVAGFLYRGGDLPEDELKAMSAANEKRVAGAAKCIELYDNMMAGKKELTSEEEFTLGAMAVQVDRNSFYRLDTTMHQQHAKWAAGKAEFLERTRKSQEAGSGAGGKAGSLIGHRPSVANAQKFQSVDNYYADFTLKTAAGPSAPALNMPVVHPLPGFGTGGRKPALLDPQLAASQKVHVDSMGQLSIDELLTDHTDGAAEVIKRMANGRLTPEEEEKVRQNKDFFTAEEWEKIGGAPPPPPPAK